MTHDCIAQSVLLQYVNGKKLIKYQDERDEMIFEFKKKKVQLDWKLFKHAVQLVRVAIPGFKVITLFLKIIDFFFGGGGYLRLK